MLSRLKPQGGVGEAGEGSRVETLGLVDELDDDGRDLLTQLASSLRADELNSNDAEALASIEAFQTSVIVTLRKRLAGPSVAKSGQDGVDQDRVNQIIYDASEGSKYFRNEQKKDVELTEKIARTLKRAQELRSSDLSATERSIDRRIAELEHNIDLSQTIVTVDVDAFYASCEELDRPELKHLPMGVGMGVLTTANYNARKFGVRSAMPVYIAKKLCPELVTVPLNFANYIKKAEEIREILAKVDPEFQAGSLDEAYMNATQWLAGHELGPEEAIADLRAEVYAKTGLSISAGIAANARLSKIGSNINKPNGQFRVENDRRAILAFMAGLPVRKVNGIGKVLERQLEALGVHRCSDIYTNRALLSQLFGQKTFDFLLHVYLGLGSTNLRPGEDDGRKSIGTESTFRDISAPDELRAKLRHIAEELEKDCVRADWAGRTLHLKLKRDTYEVYTRQRSLHGPCWRADDLYKHALPLLEREMPIRVRLMGLRLTHLTRIKRKNAAEFFDGFGIELEGSSKRPRLDDASAANEMSADEAAAAWKPSDDSILRQSKRLALEKPQNPTRSDSVEGEAAEMPRCPICARRIQGGEVAATAHVEQCLNNQAIRQALAVEARMTLTDRSDAKHRPMGKSKPSGGLGRWLRHE